MTFDAMLPTLLSTKEPANGSAWELPFKFVSGYGLTTKEIGVVLSVQGVYSMVATLFIFPVVVRKLGALGLFRTITLSYPLLYIVTPYMVLLPESVRMAGVYFLIIWKCTCATMAYPSNAILLTNSAPSLLMLGTINGVAASTASLSRAFGPTISGILFSAGLRLGYSGLAWWCSALITVAGAVISLRMTDEGGRRIDSDDDDELPYEDHVIDQCSLDSAIASASAEPLITDIDVEDLDLENPKE
jgi:hypothetical protein